MHTNSLDNILEEIKDLKGKEAHISQFINLRHKLTENIVLNLFDKKNLDEGRSALSIRDKLDETIFNTTAEDMVDGDMGGIPHMQRAILLENLSERMKIIEDVQKDAKSFGSKVALMTLLSDVDRLDRLIPIHKALVELGAKGFPLLAKRRINKIAKELRKEASNYL